ncbi:MAG TPA: hypothetical protein VHQ24_02280, partial [Lachnospiraceae bacterium]|nr:hypothetical protein [Lachnospiraceae bacterium]
GIMDQIGDSIDDLLDEIRQMSEKQIHEMVLENVRTGDHLITTFVKEKQLVMELLEEKAKTLEGQQDILLAKALEDIFQKSDNLSGMETSKQVKQSVSSKEDLIKARELRNRIIEEIQEMKEQLPFLRKNSELIEKVKTMLEGHINYKSLGVLQDFYSGDFQLLKKKYKNFMYDFNQWKQPFFETYESYLIQCSIVGEEAKAYAFIPEMAEDVIDQLQSEIKRMEELSYEQRKEAYIRDSIAEVMEEMGYDILATKDIVKKNGKKIKNKIFAYGEGSGIQVIEDNNAITMEVIGLEKGVSRMATEDEMDYLLDEQSSFCNSFSIMEEKLKEKGITRAEIIHLKPAKEYAKLVDLGQYENKKETIALVTERASKKKQKLTTQKYRMNEN